MNETEANAMMDRFARMIAESPAPDSETVNVKVGDIRGMALALLERGEELKTLRGEGPNK